MADEVKTSSNQPCIHLRTKMSYVPSERSESLLTEESPTAQYWCLKTMNFVGPDADLVGPRYCCAKGRGCYESVEMI